MSKSSEKLTIFLRKLKENIILQNGWHIGNWKKLPTWGLAKKTCRVSKFFVNIDIHLSTIFLWKFHFLKKVCKHASYSCQSLLRNDKSKSLKLDYNCFSCIFYSILGLLQLWRGWKFILPSLFCSWTSLLWSIPRRWLWKLFGCSIRMGKCFNVLLCPFCVPLCPISSSKH